MRLPSSFYTLPTRHLHTLHVTHSHPSQDWLDPSLQRNHLSDEELLHTASTIDWSQHFIPNIELLDAVDYTIIGGDGSGMIMPRLRPKDHKTKDHCTMSVKYSATMKSRFDFRRFPFEKQILQLSMKALSISDGIRFQNGKTNGFVQRKCIYMGTYIHVHIHAYIYIYFFTCSPSSTQLPLPLPLASFPYDLYMIHMYSASPYSLALQKRPYRSTRR